MRGIANLEQTTAVGSLLVGEVITRVHADKPGVYTAEEIAKALSLLSGFVLMFLGLFRLGWLIEMIPYISISAFVTSASFTIIGTQVPVALGITGIKTREAPYKVYIGILKGLGRTKLDASIGLTSIALLYALRTIFALLEKRRPQKKRLWAVLSSLRMTFTILLFTMVSWLVHRKRSREDHAFRIVGHIDSGKMSFVAGMNLADMFGRLQARRCTHSTHRAVWSRCSISSVDNHNPHRRACRDCESLQQAVRV